jgi:putative transposase
MELMDWFRKQVEQADGDVLQEMLRVFAETLMDADAQSLCNAGFNEKNPERTNTRNGYRERRWDTRAGTIDLAVPKLRQGSYFPSWLLEPRRRAEKVLIAVVADCYLAGVSTRRVDKLVRALGIEGISRSRSPRWQRA